MKISGKTTDAAAMIERTADSFSRDIMVHSLTWTGDEWLGIDTKELLAKFRCDVWNGLLDKAGARCDASPASTEEALAAVLRAGVPKQSMKFRRNAFSIDLGENTYRIYKDKSGYTGGPFFQGICTRDRCIGLAPEEFASFLLDFDALGEDIRKAFSKVLDAFEKASRERKKDAIAKMIAKKTVESLIETYLKPLGISAEYSVDRDNVTLDMSTFLKGTITVPIGRLADSLSDADAVRSQLHPVYDIGKKLDDIAKLSFFSPHFKIIP